MTETTQSPANVPSTEIPATSLTSPHIRFTEVRTRLLELEKIKGRGGDIDLKEVQELVLEASDLTAQIQTATTGPKKPSTPGEAKAKKEPKAKKVSSISHLSIPEGDDF